MSVPIVSVIIPSYNREASARRLLESIKRQTLPADQIEVIVVDDGSPQGPYLLAEHTFPFSFTCLRQKNQGATIARNYGVEHSQGQILVFIDDDVTISPHTLAVLADRCRQQEKS